MRLQRELGFVSSWFIRISSIACYKNGSCPGEAEPEILVHNFHTVAAGVQKRVKSPPVLTAQII